MVRGSQLAKYGPDLVIISCRGISRPVCQNRAPELQKLIFVKTRLALVVSVSGHQSMLASRMIRAHSFDQCGKQISHCFGALRPSDNQHASAISRCFSAILSIVGGGQPIQLWSILVRYTDCVSPHVFLYTSALNDIYAIFLNFWKLSQDYTFLFNIKLEKRRQKTQLLSFSTKSKSTCQPQNPSLSSGAPAIFQEALTSLKFPDPIWSIN